MNRSCYGINKELDLEQLVPLLTRICQYLTNTIPFWIVKLRGRDSPRPSKSLTGIFKMKNSTRRGKCDSSYYFISALVGTF